MPTAELKRKLDRARRVRPATAARRRATALAIRAGLAPYRPVDRASIADWDGEYARGELEYYADLRQLGRYSLLLGYIRHIGASSVVDIGCGAGVLADRARDLRFDRWVGVDPSPSAVDQAREALSDDSRCSFEVGDRPREGFGAFDVVIFNEVIYLVPDPAGTLDAVAGELHPGAHVLTSIWRHASERGLYRLLDERFELVDAVVARNAVDERSDRGWRVAWHRARRQAGSA